MNHVILPQDFSIDPNVGKKNKWVEASGVSLGGCFYDYLRSVDGKIVGVRYWLIGEMKFDQHPVYSQFLGDDRFLFDQAGGCVDILFDRHYTDILRQGKLSVDVVQDFGGEAVLKCGERFGIVFSLADE